MKNQTDHGNKFSEPIGKAGSFAIKAMKLTTIKIRPAIFMSVFFIILIVTFRRNFCFYRN